MKRESTDHANDADGIANRSGARIALLAAMALAGMLAISLGQDPGTQVSVRGGRTRQDGEVESGADEKLPDFVTYHGEGAERIMEIRKTFTPPPRFKFDTFKSGEKDQRRIDEATRSRTPPAGDSWTYWEHVPQYVDFWFDPETAILVQETPATVRARAESEGPSAIAVKALLLAPQTAAQYPLRCDGNLRPMGGAGGSGGEAREYHWAAKIVGGIELHIDADNNSELDNWAPDRTPEERAVRNDPSKPGRLIAVNDGDSNNNDIPDFADMLHSNKFVRAELDVSKVVNSIDASARVRFNYFASDPAQIQTNVTMAGTIVVTNYVAQTGFMRIWTKDGVEQRNPASVAEGGDYVPPGVDIEATHLFKNGATNIPLYLEGISPATSEHASIAVSFLPRAGYPGPDWLQDEVRVTVLRLGMNTDANNDGLITAEDLRFKRQPPGRILWIDKDRFWKSQELHVTYGAIALEFQGPTGDRVPEGFYAVLQWRDPTSGKSNIDLFGNPDGTEQLEVTGFDVILNRWIDSGKAYHAGEQLPAVVYAAASREVLGWLQQKETLDSSGWDQQVDLVLYSMDGTEFMRDHIALYISNTPAVAPTGNRLKVWVEDLTIPKLIDHAGDMVGALQLPMGDGVTHVSPYIVEWLTGAAMTPQAFTELRDAAMLFCLMHGDLGEVMPVAFPRTDDGYTAAQAWKSALNTPWAYVYTSQDWNCHFVVVRTQFVAQQWKSIRDTNNAILFAVTCHSAAAHPDGVTPSFIAAAGGGLSVGAHGAVKANVVASSYRNMLLTMRSSKWRTGSGAFLQEFADLPMPIFGWHGHGKVTLWPAPIWGTRAAVFPSAWSPSGHVWMIFDTLMSRELSPIEKVSGDAQFGSSTPTWLGEQSSSNRLRWRYHDPAEQSPTQMSTRPDHCFTPWSGVTFTGKKLAGDRANVPTVIQWSF